MTSDEIMDIDRAFFEANPERKFYARKTLPGEFTNSGGDKPVLPKGEARAVIKKAAAVMFAQTEMSLLSATDCSVWITVIHKVSPEIRFRVGVQLATDRATHDPGLLDDASCEHIFMSAIGSEGLTQIRKIKSALGS